jgi:hypothetical protein
MVFVMALVFGRTEKAVSHGHEKSPGQGEDNNGQGGEKQAEEDYMPQVPLPFKDKRKHKAPL